MATTWELSVQFSIEVMIRGYHANESVWVAVLGEELACKRERGNSKDPFAVAVTKSERIVSHVPRKISAVCTMFLRRGGSIICWVTGSRRYSEDLPQGRLEIPCVLTFKVKKRDSAKVKKLVMAALHPIPDENGRDSKARRWMWLRIVCYRLVCYSCCNCSSISPGCKNRLLSKLLWDHISSSASRKENLLHFQQSNYV